MRCACRRQARETLSRSSGRSISRSSSAERRAGRLDPGSPREVARAGEAAAPEAGGAMRSAARRPARLVPPSRLAAHQHRGVRCVPASRDQHRSCGRRQMRHVGRHDDACRHATCQCIARIPRPGRPHSCRAHAAPSSTRRAGLRRDRRDLGVGGDDQRCRRAPARGAARRARPRTCARQRAARPRTAAARAAASPRSAFTGTHGPQHRALSCTAHTAAARAGAKRAPRSRAPRGPGAPDRQGRASESARSSTGRSTPRASARRRSSITSPSIRPA